MKRYILIILILLSPLTVFLQADNLTSPLISIVPRPTQIVPGSGNFTFSAKTAFAVENQEQAAIARNFIDLFTRAAGITPALNVGSKEGQIRFVTDSSFKTAAYLLEITPQQILIKASDTKGFFYALQSIRQLLPAAIESEQPVQNIAWSVPAMTVRDEPRFGFRGLLLDPVRCFIPKENVLRIIDCMAMLKINKLHFHLTDDNGWRIEIKKYPKLIEVGSKRKCSGLGWEWENDQFDNIPQSGHYTQEDIKEIVAYAKKLNITIVPEIEILTHSSAAIASYPQLGTTKKQIEVECRMGVFSEIIDVSDDFAIQFMHDVLDEVMALFPGEYIHIGGDEAHGNHWANSQSIRSLKNSLGITENFELQIWYFNQINKYLNEKGRKMMGWSDMAGPVGVASKMAVDMPGAISQYWAGSVDVLNHSLRLGFKVVQSHTDFAYFNAGLQNAYLTSCIPERVDATKVKNIIGFEASCWSEWDSTLEKTFDHIFPRIAAYAETAWSKQSAKDYTNFKYRLSPMWDLWKARGIYVGGMDEKNYPGPGW